MNRILSALLVGLFAVSVNASADIVLSNDGKTLLVPDMKAGELDFVPIKNLK